MKEKYISLMETTLEAYSYEHIERYFNSVKADRLREHGFPRLTANIGILIAHGRKRELLPIFMEMMDYCCENIPKVKAANDFSVKEIIFCIMELEGKGVVSDDDISRWKACLKTIDPTTCYNQYAKKPTDKLFNWALFTAVSEHMRTYIGLCDSSEFVDIQIPTQLHWLDENLMYQDDENYPPMVYDLVPRGLFAVLLHFGYKGKYYNEIDACLRKAGLLTLKMQSVSGEIPYGGRSAQFPHNEAHLALVFEYEASRYAKEGDLALAGEFKYAARKALENIEYWLSRRPIRHIKNRFPTETGYGCEDYAYFDKYMITTASFLYVAQIICDESIPEKTIDRKIPYTAQTSDRFHKVFLNAGGYFLEFDTRADMHYDASGLGRIHKDDAPSSICMSSPCSSTPNYKIDKEGAVDLSLAPGHFYDGRYIFATSPSSKYELKGLASDEKTAFAEFEVTLNSGDKLETRYTVGEGGVNITLSGNRKIAHMLPAFDFDGEEHSEIFCTENMLEIKYQGWMCRYTTDGKIVNSGSAACNRNGHYKVFYANGESSLSVMVEILKTE